MEFLRVDWVILKEKIVLSLTCFSGGQWRRETWILPYSLPTPTTSLKLEVKFLHQSRWKIQIAPHYCYFGFNNIERESDSSHLPFFFSSFKYFFFPFVGCSSLSSLTLTILYTSLHLALVVFFVCFCCCCYFFIMVGMIEFVSLQIFTYSKAYSFFLPAPFLVQFSRLNNCTRNDCWMDVHINKGIFLKKKKKEEEKKWKKKKNSQ